PDRRSLRRTTRRPRRAQGVHGAVPADSPWFRGTLHQYSTLALLVQSCYISDMLSTQVQRQTQTATRRTPRVAVVVIDGLPVDLGERAITTLPFLSSRVPYRPRAVSCFPSTTGPAYFPLLAGCTPGRANVPGIRWFDRTRPTRTAFPHRGLRSYVGPDAHRLPTDTAVTTLYARHAWPASSPIGKDLPKRGEIGRDAIWTFAHVTHGGDQAAAGTSRKLGRGLDKGREIVFAVYPSVDELGHTRGIAGGEPEEALARIDRELEIRLDGFDGDVVVTAD